MNKAVVRRRCVFRGMDSGVRWGRKTPWVARPRGQGAIGTPSAGLSLGGLLASRAHRRFTRQAVCTARPIEEQVQAGSTATVGRSLATKAGRGVAKDCSFLV